MGEQDQTNEFTAGPVGASAGSNLDQLSLPATQLVVSLSTHSQGSKVQSQPQLCCACVDRSGGADLAVLESTSFSFADDEGGLAATVPAMIVRGVFQLRSKSGT